MFHLKQNKKAPQSLLAQASRLQGIVYCLIFSAEKIQDVETDIALQAYCQAHPP